MQPEFIRRLRHEVWPVYTELLPPREARTKVATNDLADAVRSGLPELARPILAGMKAANDPVLNARLDSWAQVHNLNEEWVKGYGMAILQHWRSNPESLCSDAFPAISPNLSWVLNARLIEGFTFEADPWLVEEETWQDYQQEVKRQFNERLLAYKAELRDYPAQYGNDSMRGAGRHQFRWLAQYQVLANSPATIAGAGKVDVSTITKAVQVAAERIGLRLRPSRKGRRKKM